MKRIIILGFVFSLFHFEPAISQAAWTQKANFGGGLVSEARAFSIGNFGYFAGPFADLWRYDPVADSWTQMAVFIGPTRLSCVAFSIGNKGYLGTGNSFNDFYEYDAISNSWSQKAFFGGSGREGAVGIAIDGKGYIGTGGGYLKDWWEYDPINDFWSQKADLTGPTRYHAGAFTIGSKGYVCTGFNGTFFNDLWEFDPALNSWNAKATLPGGTRDRPVGLGTATKGYIISGWTGTAPLNDAWEYDPVADAWIQLPSMPTAGRYNSCGFTISNKLYIGTGIIVGGGNDFWEFGPDCLSQTSTIAATCGGSCDGSASIVLPAAGAIVSYLWSNGQTTATAINLCAGNYSVTVTDTSGCSSVTSFIISEPVPVSATAGITQPTCFGDSDGILCAIPNSTPVSFLWANGDTTSCLQNIPSGVYTVTVTDSAGCIGVIPLTLTQPGDIAINFNHLDASCSTCADGYASAQITGGTQPLSYQWSTGSTLAFLNNLLPGLYSFCVTDANGCSKCDTVEIEFSVGIDDIENSSMQVSPNPFNDYVSISVHPNTKLVSIKMFDVFGKELIVKSFSSSNIIKIETEYLQSGVYFIELKDQMRMSVVKVIKQ